MGSAKRKVLVVPIGDLPPEPMVYVLRKALFGMAESARKGIHKDVAKALEEAGRGIKAEERS